MEEKILIELKVINKQLSQIRRTSPLLPSLKQLYLDVISEVRNED